MYSTQFDREQTVPFTRTSLQSFSMTISIRLSYVHMYILYTHIYILCRLSSTHYHLESWQWMSWALSRSTLSSSWSLSVMCFRMSLWNTALPWTVWQVLSVNTVMQALPWTARQVLSVNTWSCKCLWSTALPWTAREVLSVNTQSCKCLWSTALPWTARQVLSVNTQSCKCLWSTALPWTARQVLSVNTQSCKCLWSTAIPWTARHTEKQTHFSLLSVNTISNAQHHDEKQHIYSVDVLSGKGPFVLLSWHTDGGAWCSVTGWFKQIYYWGSKV